MNGPEERLFEANLAALDRFHPNLVRVLRPLADEPDTAQWGLSRTGLATVRRSGVAWTSSMDPRTEARRSLPNWGLVDLVVATSLGAGYQLEALMELYPDLPLVVAEEDLSWFAEVLRHRDLCGLWASRYVVPLVGPDTALVGAFLRQWACRHVELLHWRPAVDARPPWARAVAEQVAGAQAAARVNLATYERFAALWQRNLTHNEARATEVRPLTALAGAGAGLPVVIAAAGPSLADQFSWLKAHRRQFLLLAVDTAWNSLAAQGLVPDLLLVLDGQYWNARHVDRVPPPPCLVVTEWTAPPRAFRLAPGRTYVAASSLSFLRCRERERWGELGTLASGGSVATAAWSLALVLGSSEVAFAGLDLGYPRGQTHVPGSQFEEAVHRRSRRLAPAETLGLSLLGPSTSAPAASGEGTVRSDPRMDLFRAWLTASVAQHPEVRAVNLGTRGSFVPGLLPPPPHYGDDWPEVAPLSLSAAPPLRPLTSSFALPPFGALEGVLTAEDFAPAWMAASDAAASFWGSEVWEAWAGRASRTWHRWPSARSREAVEEVVRAALDWQRFWPLPSFSCN